MKSITTTAMSAISPFSSSTSASSLVPMQTSEEDLIVINTDTTSDSDDYSAESETIYHDCLVFSQLCVCVCVCGSQ